MLNKKLMLASTANNLIDSYKLTIGNTISSSNTQLYGYALNYKHSPNLGAISNNIYKGYTISSILACIEQYSSTFRVTFADEAGPFREMSFQVKNYSESTLYFDEIGYSTRLNKLDFDFTANAGKTIEIYLTSSPIL